MTELIDRYKHVRTRIAEACSLNGRNPDSVQLLAVSKKKSVNAITQVANIGQHDFGENYLQESLEKIEALKELGLTWHFIGPIQSNKTRSIAEHFSWVHSVDRVKIAKRLSEQRPSELPPLNICLQINIDKEESKSGFLAEEIEDVVSEIAKLPMVSLRGLMAIPNPELDTEQAFTKIETLFNTIKSQYICPQWDTLSMGMSADLELAIAHGATIVRIGSDIFGPRD